MKARFSMASTIKVWLTAAFAALAISATPGCAEFSGLKVPEVSGKPVVAREIKTVADGYIVLASVRATVADMLSRKAIEPAKARELNADLDKARLSLDEARSLTGVAAESKLQLAVAILLQVEARMK